MLLRFANAEPEILFNATMFFLKRLSEATGKAIEKANEIYNNLNTKENEK